ncbi:hypothetical protein HID58_059750 [Brassica napus]|uniref:Uncharacterized protein n=1 Tax=Brassica napus TaxID=3708 RepID=A0ABQ7ZTS7_BRANA|nr:hypothetical protein HID58_059750 [Brassica napus]
MGCKASRCTSTAGATARDDMLLLDAMATMMPVTVNVNRFATHMPNTSPALTYAACYNTSWILRSLCLFYYCESDMNFAIITLCLDLLFIGPSMFSEKMNKATNCKRGIRNLLGFVRFWNVDAVRNNVLLAVPALLYAIKNYIRFTATMMPVTVNVNRFATHMPNTSPALTYAACYNTSWILRSLCLFYYCESDMNFAIITLCLDLLFIGPSMFSEKMNKATNCKRGIRKFCNVDVTNQ